MNKGRASRSCKHCLPLNVLNVEAKETGRTASATQTTATYNVMSAENVVTGSAKPVGTALMSLQAFKVFIESH